MALQIRDLSGSRYSITTTYNDVSFSFNGLGRLNVMSTTYKSLMTTHIARLREISKSSAIEQVCRNHLTALRGFLKTNGKTESSPVGAELADDFENCLKLHLKNTDLSTRSIADRRSLLCAWKLSFELMNEATEPAGPGRQRKSASTANVQMNAFEAELKAALRKAQLTPKTAARKARVSTSALGRWSRGALPNARSLGNLKKLERALSLPENQLCRLVVGAAAAYASTSTIRSRQLASSRTQSPYLLKEGMVNEQLLAEWRDYFDYKTSTSPGTLKRHPKGRWTLAYSKDSSTSPNRLNSREKRVCATAGLTWSYFSSFFGFLSLAKSEGGYGIESAQSQTMAWLAVPAAVDAYLEFMTDRSDGLKHGGHKSFCSAVAALTNSKAGYLTQLEFLCERLPDTVRNGKVWKDLCSETFNVVMAWKQESTGKSRDPAAPLKFFFDKEFPLSPIFSAMARLRAEAEAAPSGSIPEAVARRDELILGLLVSNPLRAKNLVTMTYNQLNSGGIYMTSSGAWRIRIAGSHFKNRSRVGAETYDVPVASWLGDLVSDYVSSFRPRLLQGEGDCGYFFVSSRDGKRFSTLNRQVFQVTKRYIPGCGGIGPHAFRHLVATDWLTKNPNDFVTVAELLNDSIEVVIKSYAHLKKETSFARYDEYITQQIPNH